MKNIFSRVDSTHQEVKQNVEVDYNIGDVLDVTSGPFAGNKVTITGIQGSKILGQLDMFGRSVPAEFTTNQLYKETKNG